MPTFRFMRLPCPSNEGALENPGHEIVAGLDWRSGMSLPGDLRMDIEFHFWLGMSVLALAGMVWQGIRH
ncbi:hypothetical protein [Azotobacter chroococcum]|jgi:hypothetical protein|nr:hypothetical protein [Azotobacter chroococcum]